MKFTLDKLSSTKIKFGALILLSIVSFGLAALYILPIHILSTEQPLPNIDAIVDVKQRKQAFFDYLTPIIQAENQSIRKDRDSLLDIASDLGSSDSPSFLQGRKLKSLAEKYRIEWEPEQFGEIIKQLELRIDTVPLPLVLVQAAKESGWGTSKFARQGNNLFGQWCFRKGCGIVPAKRSNEAQHEVRIFQSIRAAVAGYLHNLNTGRNYHELREIRIGFRKAGKPMDSLSLADGLLHYSQRRQAYVDEVKAMIQQNRTFWPAQN